MATNLPTPVELTDAELDVVAAGLVDVVLVLNNVANNNDIANNVANNNSVLNNNKFQIGVNVAALGAAAGNIFAPQ